VALQDEAERSATARLDVVQSQIPICVTDVVPHLIEGKEYLFSRKGE
jgi:hypothetical protein